MSIFKKLKGIVKGVLGIDSGDDQARAQREELERLKQASQLSAAQEQADVAKFDDLETDTFSGSEGVRKKRKTGNMYGNPLGLGVQ